MRILVQYQKDDVRYYNATTDEQLYKASLKILGENMEQGFYVAPEPVRPLDFDPSEINVLPASLRAEAKRYADVYQRTIQHYENELAKFNQIERALREDDGRLAWRILNSRKRNEYERVEVESVIDLDSEVFTIQDGEVNVNYVKLLQAGVQPMC